MSIQKNILITYSAQIISVISSFLCSVMAARMLGASGQGELALYINFMMLAGLLLGLGLPSAIVHFIASKKIDKQKIFSLLIGVVLLGLIFLLLLLFILDQTKLLNSILPVSIFSNAIWLSIMIFHIIIVLFNIFLGSMLQAESQFGKAGRITILGSLILLIMYAVDFFSNHLIPIATLNWIIVAMLSSQLIQMTLYIKQLYNINIAYFHWSKVELKFVRPLLQFAAIAFFTNLIQFFSYRMDIWFVNHFHGKHATGIYALSTSLSQMVWLLPHAAQSVLYAFISTHQDKSLNIQKTIDTTKQIAIYAVLAGIAGYLISIFFVPILFGTEFEPSVQSIGILLFGIVPFCLSMAVSAYFAATGRVHINLYSAIIGFVLCLIADLLLIPPYGIVGAAVASVISYLSTVTYLLLRFRKEKP